MDVDASVEALSALAQSTRLKVFRLLVQSGPEGLPAMDIAEKLDVRKSLMSTHLGTLNNAGLTTTRRKGRQVFHAIDMETTRELLMYLVKDCCQGHPDTCGQLLEAILPVSTCPAPSDTSRNAESVC